MDWKHLLAYITGTVDQELLLRNEYLVTENRMLRNQIKGRVRLDVQVTEKIGGKGLQLLRRFHQPLEHRARIDLKDSGGGPNTQALGQAGQHAHELCRKLAKTGKSGPGSH
jgi:hypothetical protein